MLATIPVRAAAFALTDQLVADRRHFHRNPELGLQEHETAAYIAKRLRKLGIDHQTGIAKTGVVGLIKGAKPGHTILLRADMDALPLTEETGADYASKRPGVMHACGHDGHTAILLGVAEVLAQRRDQFNGTVKLVFQPAEEGPGGAEAMIAAGVMEAPHVDVCFGLHLSNESPVGHIIVQGGPVQASADTFELVVQGVGGHGAMPEQTVDAVAIGAAIVNELQRIISREISPTDTAVVTVGSFHGGTASNIIAQRAVLQGTLRTLNPETRAFAHRRIREVATHVAQAARATCDVTFDLGYPVTINNERIAAFTRAVAETVVPPEQVHGMQPVMASEDMSFFLNAAPGCFAYLGSSNPARNLHHPHHSPRFDFDEACLPIGVELLSQLALTALSES